MKKNLHVALIVSAVAIGTLSTPALAISSANYYITSIATPDVATGGITIVGDALFVGVGGFGGATQSIVRIDSGGTTTIADGFNAISGMVYDPINDRLVVGDNCFGVQRASRAGKIERARIVEDSRSCQSGPVGFPETIREPSYEMLRSCRVASLALNVQEQGDV